MNTKEIDIDIEIMDEIVCLLRSNLITYANIIYPYPKHPERHIFFIRNVLLNLIGNFILMISDPKKPEDFNTNGQYMIEDLQKWFVNVKDKIQEEKELKQCQLN